MKSQIKPNYTERYYDEVDQFYNEWRTSVFKDSLGEVEQEGKQIGASGWVEVLDTDGTVIVEINQNGMTWAHATTHQDGGSDEVSIQGLAGTPLELTAHLTDTIDAHDASAISLLDTAAHTTATEVESAIAELYAAAIKDHGALTGLADDDHPQYATNVEFDDHSARHELAGADVISVAGLSGLLATAQTPAGHAVSHQDGGTDEISVVGLSGLLATAQTPTAHAASHAENAADEILAENLGTASMTTTHVLAPDGTGGVAFRAESGGGGGVTDHGALTGLADDDHTQYQLESEKGAISGYASLDASTKVPIAQLPTGTTGTTVALGDAAAALDATHVAAADPHVGYRLESADHTHATAGLQGGTVAHSALTGLTTGDPHTQYPLQTEFDDHSARHELAGADVISVAGLSGLLATAQTPAAHAASHAENAADELLVENLGATSLTTTHVLSPDGTGGVVMRAEASGGSLTDHTHNVTGSGATGGGSVLHPSSLEISGSEIDGNGTSLKTTKMFDFHSGVELQPRTRVSSSGMLLGDGISVVDTALSRGAANRLDLATGDSMVLQGGNLDVKGEITAEITASPSIPFSVYDPALGGGSGANVFTIDDDGAAIASIVSVASGALTRYVPMAEQVVASGSSAASIASTLSAAITGVPADAIAVDVYLRINPGTGHALNSLEVRHATLDTRAGIVYGQASSSFNAINATVQVDSSQRIRYSLDRRAGTIGWYIACVGYHTIK